MAKLSWKSSPAGILSRINEIRRWLGPTAAGQPFTLDDRLQQRDVVLDMPGFYLRELWDAIDGIGGASPPRPDCLKDMDGHQARNIRSAPRPWNDETILDALGLAAAWCESSIGGHKAGAGARKARPATRRLKANDQMRLILEENSESNGWSIEDWSQKTGFSKSTIHDCEMWKTLHAMHVLVKIEHKNDRHRNSSGRRS